jgi:hypothetical protein
MMRFGSVAARTLLAAFAVGLCGGCGESSTTPTLPNCSVVGTGSGTAAGGTMTGTFTLIAACSDAIESVTNVRLTLSR